MARVRVSVCGLLLAVMLLFATIVTVGATAGGPGALSVYFIDVEQGNCILIVSPTGTAALIDAGTGQHGDGASDGNPVTFIRGLMDAELTFNLQYVIATHYDADHIGKLDDVLTAGLLGPNGTVFDRGDINTSDATYIAYRSGIGSHRRVRLVPGTAIDLGGGAELNCVAVNGSYATPTGTRSVSITASDENAHSAAFILTYGSDSFWFGGDLTSDVEAAVAPFVPDVDVYAVDHHGSTTSSSPTLLGALKPDYAVVQAGQDNSYGHPRKEVVGTILGTLDTSGAAPQVIYQNHANASDNRSDDALASAIADPDGPGPLPGTILFQTDGLGAVALTLPGARAEYTLAVSVSPAEGGTAAPSSTGTYVAGATITIVATPNAGYVFDHWEGDASGNAATTTVTMSSSKSVRAIFALDRGHIGSIQRGDLVIYSVLPNGPGSTAKTEIPNETITLKNLTSRDIDLLSPMPITLCDENACWTASLQVLDAAGLPHVIPAHGTWSISGAVYNPTGNSSAISLRNTGERITVKVGDTTLDCWTYPDATGKEGVTFTRSDLTPGTCT